MYCLEIIAAISLKVCSNIQMNKLMKLNEYQRSRSLFDLGQRSLRIQNIIFFFSETVKSFRTKFHMKIYVCMEMKIYTNEKGHMTKVAAMPMYGKNLKNLLLQNQ